MEGIFYIWIGQTIESDIEWYWDCDEDSPVYGEEYGIQWIHTEWRLECITDDNDIICDGSYKQENLADGRPYNHIAFSYEDAMKFIPKPRNEYY